VISIEAGALPRFLSCLLLRRWDAGGTPALRGLSSRPTAYLTCAGAPAGGSAEAATIDALDEQVVDKHLQHVIDKAGRVDISFNAVGIPDTRIVGVPLIELDAEHVP
jgi:NAD(P)-dependent dehydrogenase (short-subunit alcohol dehydrogenase family)